MVASVSETRLAVGDTSSNSEDRCELPSQKLVTMVIVMSSKGRVMVRGQLALTSVGPRGRG